MEYGEMVEEELMEVSIQRRWWGVQKYRVIENVNIDIVVGQLEEGGVIGIR